MHVFYWLFILSYLGAQVVALYPKNTENVTITRIAFGSCSKTTHQQKLWPFVMDYDPDLWIWLGDNVYADKKLSILPIFWPRPLNEVKEIYQTQYDMEGYSELRKSKYVVGIWDDHDGGLNNMDKHFINKDAVKAIALDFFDEPLESPRRTRSGMYESYTFGPPGRKVQIVLPDLRYHRDPHNEPNADLLGEEQWAWLESVLLEEEAEIRIIGSALQVLTDLHALMYPLGPESWSLYPRCRERLLDIVVKNNVSGTVFLSGDVHYADLAKESCWAGGDAYYPAYDFSSSGMTHTIADIAPQSIKGAARIWTLWALPVPSRLFEPFSEHNFGTITIHWGDDHNPGDETTIEMAVVGENGEAAWRHIVPLRDLQLSADPRAPDQPPPEHVVCSKGRRLGLVEANRFRLSLFVLLLVVTLLLRLLWSLVRSFMRLLWKPGRATGSNRERAAKVKDKSD
eukprot:Rmarinus@m.13617